MTAGLHTYLLVSLLLFAIGFFGVLSRRNVLVLLMSIELMLNAANLAFVAFSQFYEVMEGVVAALFVMGVSAAEAGVGLAFIVLMIRSVSSPGSGQKEEILHL